MIVNIVLIVMGVICIFIGGQLSDHDDNFSIIGVIMGLITIIAGCAFIHIDTKEYYEKYIPNLQEQVLQGKMLELDNQLKELE